jgi:polysaccharide biosynthesis protein VpsM
VQKQDTDYDYASTSTAVSQDSDQTAVNLGLTWRATAKTNAAFRIGRVERDYVDPARKDFKGTNWDLSLNWSPLTYSQFSFTAARQVRDSISSGSAVSDYVLADIYSLRWNHAWMSRVRSTVALSRERSDYENSSREDTLDKLLMGVYYDFRSYLSVGLEYSPSSRDSTDNQYDFDRRQTMVVLQAKF